MNRWLRLGWIALTLLAAAVLPLRIVEIVQVPYPAPSSTQEPLDLNNAHYYILADKSP